jgi:LAO/AO transport system kinase
VLCYSGFYGTGVKEIWDMIYEYVDFVKANGYFDYRRNEQAKYWMYETINEQLKLSFYNNSMVQSMLSESEQSVLDGRQTSFVAAQELLDNYFRSLR